MLLKKKFKSFELRAKAAINNFSSGSHFTFLKDSTSEIDTVRQYQGGDKKLDSKSSLKASLTMSRVFNPEKELTLYLILDISASQQSKSEMAITICLFLSYLADILFDKVCLVSYSDLLDEIVLPTNDTRQVVNALEKIYENNFHGKSNIDFALNYLRGLDPNNSLVFFISDFTFDLSEKLKNNIKSVNSISTNKCIALALSNGLELKFDEKLSGTFYDLETNRSVDWSGKDLTEFSNKWLSNIKLEFNKIKTDCILLDYENDFLNKLGKYLIRV